MESPGGDGRASGSLACSPFPCSSSLRSRWRPPRPSLIPRAQSTSVPSGLYAQSTIIEDFGRGMEHLAALIYLVVLIGAIVSFAVFGNYRMALYFFLGPALFHWVLTTEPHEKTELRFGGRVSQEVGQKDIFNMLIDGD